MDSKKVELLYKKNLGLPYSVPGAGANSESGNSRPFIQSGRIMNQAIPASVVATDFSPATNTVALGNSASYVRDATMSYIKYYFITLDYIKPGFSYTSPLLSQAIPFNFDKLGSYKYYVYATGINNGNQILQDDANYSWIVDPDAGILTFFNSVGDNATVTISFYRYEGTFGVGGGGGIPNIPATQIVYMGSAGLTGSSLVTVDSLGKLNAGNLNNSFVTYANTFTQSLTASSVNYYGASWNGSLTGLSFDISGMGAVFFNNAGIKQLAYIANVNEPKSATIDLLITPGSFGTKTTDFTVQIGIGVAAGHPICRIRYRSSIGATTGYTISVIDPSNNALKFEPITANNSTARPLKIVFSSKSIIIYDNGNLFYTGSNTDFGTTTEFTASVVRIQIFIAVDYTLAPRVGNFSITSNYNPTTHALLSGGDILPTIPGNYNLGSAQIPFNNLFVSNIQTTPVTTTQVAYMGSAGLTGSSLVTVDSVGKLNVGASSTSTILAYSNTLTSSLVGHSVNYYGSSLTGTGFSFGPSGMSSPANTTPVATYIGGVNEAIDATINFSVIPGNCVSATAGAVAYSRVAIYDTSGSRFFTIEYSAERNAVNSFKISIYDSTRTPSLITGLPLIQSNLLPRPVKIVRSSKSIAFYDISYNVNPIITLTAGFIGTSVIGNQMTISIFNDGGSPSTISNFSVTPTYIPLNYALFSGGDIIPKMSTTYNLGSAPNPFNSLFVSNIQTGSAIAIGSSAGFTGQRGAAVAIGNQAGYSGQGANSIAIGSLAGVSGQAANSIILNASGATLNATTSGTFIAPIRPAGTTFTLNYNPLTNEVSYNSALALTALVANTQVAYMGTAGLTGSSLVTVDTLGKLNIGASNTTTIQSYANDFKTDLSSNSVNLYGSTFTGSGFSFGTSGMSSSTPINGNSTAVATYIGGANESVSAEINVTLVPGVCSGDIFANYVSTQIFIYDTSGSRYFLMDYRVTRNISSSFFITLSDFSNRFTPQIKSINESVLNARTVKIIRSPTSISFLDNGVVLYTVTGTDLGITVVGKQIQLGINGFIGPTRSSFSNFSVTSNYIPPNYALFTGGDIVPNLPRTYNLGSTVNPFNSLYVSNVNGLSARLSTTTSIAIGDSTAGSTSQKTNALAIGNSAGQTNQGISSIAIGTQAGQTNQLDNAVAIGFNAGLTGQQGSAIAIGNEAGYSIQSSNAVAVGNQAGRLRQGGSAVAIGNSAGSSGQGGNSIAIGSLAGFTGQAPNSIILNATGITLSAGTSGTFITPIRPIGTASVLNYNPTTYEVSYTPALSLTTQGTTGVTGQFLIAQNVAGATAMFNQPVLGYLGTAGITTYGNAINSLYSRLSTTNSIAIGDVTTGSFSQSSNTIAIGRSAGVTSQQAAAIAIGNLAGASGQGANSIAIGSLAGFTGQANNSIILNATGITMTAGTSGTFITPIRPIGTASVLNYNPSTYEVSYTPALSLTTQGTTGVTGQFLIAQNVAGATAMFNQPVLGYLGASGITTYGNAINSLYSRMSTINSIAIGDVTTGSFSQSSNTIAIGRSAGVTSQQAAAIAIGNSAGSSGQGANSIAIGSLAGFTGQAPNSIILNATGITLSAGTSGTFITPIRPIGTASVLNYNPATYEVSYTPAITSTQVAYMGAAGLTGSPLVTVDSNGRLNAGAYNAPTVTWVSYENTLTTGFTASNINYYGGMWTSSGNAPEFYNTGVLGLSVSLINTTATYTGGSNESVAAVINLMLAIGFSNGAAHSVDIIFWDINNRSFTFKFSTASSATSPTNYTITVIDSNGTASLSPVTITGSAVISHSVKFVRASNRLALFDNNIIIADVSGAKIGTSVIGKRIDIVITTGFFNQLKARAGVSNFSITSDYIPLNYALLAGGDILPNASTTYNLGAQRLPFNSLYVSNIQTGSSVAIGVNAGSTGQGGITGGAIAIGNNAGYSGQGANSIAIGSLAGFTGQAANSIILNATGITMTAGTSGTFITPIRPIGTASVLNYNPATYEVSYTPALPALSLTTQGTTGVTGQFLIAQNVAGATAIFNQPVLGYLGAAGITTYGNAINNLYSKLTEKTNIAIGNILTGAHNVGPDAIAIGISAGMVYQNKRAIAIGYNAGLKQSDHSIAIGANAAGDPNAIQYPSCIAIGEKAGYLNQGYFNGQGTAIAIGPYAGASRQGTGTLAMGQHAGEDNQGNAGVAFGSYAGAISQGKWGLAIGSDSGFNRQGNYALAIGSYSGNLYQGPNSVAIGDHAGQNNLGQSSVAIGYYASQDNGSTNNTIVFNATGVALNPQASSACYIAPVRNGVTSPTIILAYDANSGEVTYGPKSSDFRLKTDISGTKLGLDFINALNPVEFRWKDRVNGNLFDSCGNLVTSSNPGKRLHQGFIAQEVKATLDSFGADSGIFFNISDGPIEINGLNGLRHDELIAPVVKAIQEQSKMIQLLQQQVAALQKLCGLSATGLQAATGLEGQGATGLQDQGAIGLQGQGATDVEGHE
jgi:hypothetical protein